MNNNPFADLKKTLIQLNQVIDNLETGKFSLIDFDISLEKTRKIYEELSELKQNTLGNKSYESPFSVENIEDINDNSNIKEEDLSERIDQEALLLMDQKEEIEVFFEKSNPTEEDIISDNNSDEIDQEEEIYLEPENIEKTEKKKKIQTSSDTIADKFENKTSLNDILINIKENNDLASQLEKRPISDLKSAIGLNDKIWFTRELFNGKNDTYLTTIEKINKSKKIEEASKIVGEFSWDMENVATKRFMELIYRKFI